MLLHTKIQTGAHGGTAARAHKGASEKAEYWAAGRAGGAPDRQQLKGRLPGTELLCLQCVVLPLRYHSAPCTQHSMLHDNGLKKKRKIYAYQQSYWEPHKAAARSYDHRSWPKGKGKVLT